MRSLSATSALCLEPQVQSGHPGCSLSLEVDVQCYLVLFLIAYTSMSAPMFLSKATLVRWSPSKLYYLLQLLFGINQ